MTSLVKKVLTFAGALSFAFMINVSCARNPAPNVDEVKQEKTEAIEEEVKGGVEGGVEGETVGEGVLVWADFSRPVTVTYTFSNRPAPYAEEDIANQKIYDRFDAKQYGTMQAFFKHSDLVAKATLVDKEIFYNDSLEVIGIKFHFEDALLLKYIDKIFPDGVESYPFEAFSYELTPAEYGEYEKDIIRERDKRNLEGIDVITLDVLTREKGERYIFFADNNKVDGKTKHQVLTYYNITDSITQSDMLDFVMRDYVEAAKNNLHEKKKVSGEVERILKGGDYGFFTLDDGAYYGMVSEPMKIAYEKSDTVLLAKYVGKNTADANGTWYEFEETSIFNKENSQWALARQDSIVEVFYPQKNLNDSISQKKYEEMNEYEKSHLCTDSIRKSTRPLFIEGKYSLLFVNSDNAFILNDAFHVNSGCSADRVFNKMLREDYAVKK